MESSFILGKSRDFGGIWEFCECNLHSQNAQFPWCRLLIRWMNEIILTFNLNNTSYVEPSSKSNDLGVFENLDFFPIFSLYTYWTMYSANFKSFRLKMTSESLISRYVVQNSTFEISPFKVSSHIPWYNKCTMKILKKKRVEKMPPMLHFFLRWQIKGQWWRKNEKNRIDFF